MPGGEGHGLSIASRHQYISCVCGLLPFSQEKKESKMPPIPVYGTPVGHTIFLIHAEGKHCI